VAKQLIQLQEGHLHAMEALLKCYHTKEPCHQFQKGDQVWLDGHNLAFVARTKKLGPKQLGPFQIIQKVSLVAYCLDLPDSFKMHNVFHLDLLSLYTEMAQYGPVFLPPPPDLVNGHEEQELEAILNPRKKRGSNSLQYLISWKRFLSSKNEWVNEAHMHVEHLIEQ